MLAKKWLEDELDQKNAQKKIALNRRKVVEREDKK